VPVNGLVDVNFYAEFVVGHRGASYQPREF
jgi:hypothetical protein